MEALCDRSEGGSARRAALGSLKASGGVSADALAAAPPPLASFLGEHGVAQRRAAAAARVAREEAAQLAVAGDGGPRQRRATTVMVDGFAIKRANLYDLEGGEPSVWATEAGRHGRKRAAGDEGPQQRGQIAGKDYSHSSYCQASCLFVFFFLSNCVTHYIIS